MLGVQFSASEDTARVVRGLQLQQEQQQNLFSITTAAM